jgi:hypothetical protein
MRTHLWARAATALMSRGAVRHCEFKPTILETQKAFQLSALTYTANPFEVVTKNLHN